MDTYRSFIKVFMFKVLMCFLLGFGGLSGVDALVLLGKGEKASILDPKSHIFSLPSSQSYFIGLG